MAQEQSAKTQKLLYAVGIKPMDGQRGQCDIVGFASTAEQMSRIVSMCSELASAREDTLRNNYPWMKSASFRAGICPHDDYCYAGRLYPLLTSRIRAKRVILFGVFHKALAFNCENVLVFDSFKSWHGPNSPVPVSLLREELLERIPKGDAIVNNDMQQVEHSVEAIVPWLQAFNPDVEIVSILVPYMSWETIERMAGEVSNAVAGIMEEKGWKLGDDVAIICSSDAVHYGDKGWKNNIYTPLGSGIEGYIKAVKRDTDMVNRDLTGAVNMAGFYDLFTSCVDPDNVYEYRNTWCGRFSISFGMTVATQIAAKLNEPPLEGVLLDYGTSVSEATLPLDSLQGMGRTAPNNLHHWVGYAAVGYK